MMNGKEVDVAAGFDRPLGTLFLTVFQVDEEDCQPIFDGPALDGPWLDVVDVEAALDDLKIAVPKTLLPALQLDLACRAGNLVVEHSFQS
jgi:hypothetical protein